MAAQALSRVADVGAEDGALRGILAGLFPADLPVLPLALALEPVQDAIATFAQQLKLALKQGKKLQKKHPAMTVDMCSAIVFYTMEAEPREGSLYYHLNGALRAKDRAAVRPWRDYIWLLLHALRKLPASDKTVAFRGCQRASSALGFDLTPGSDFQWAAFSSTATTIDVMKDFLGTTGPRTLFFLQLNEPVFNCPI